MFAVIIHTDRATYNLIDPDTHDWLSAMRQIAVEGERVLKVDYEVTVAA